MKVKAHIIIRDQVVLAYNIEWNVPYNKPSSLTFTVIKDSKVSFQPGEECYLNIDDKLMWTGVVFTKNRSSLGEIKVTALDNLRYLQNRLTLNFVNEDPSSIIKQVISLNGISPGAISGVPTTPITQYYENIESKEIILEQFPYRDIYIYSAKDGKIKINQPIERPIYPIADENVVDYNYTVTIDKDYYNEVLIIDKSKEDIIDFIEAKDAGEQGKRGIIRYAEVVSSFGDHQKYADDIIKEFGKMNRVIGSIRVVEFPIALEISQMVPAKLALGDINLNEMVIIHGIRRTINGGWLDTLVDIRSNTMS